MTASNQLSNYGDVQTGTHPARRDPDRRSIRTQGRRPSLLRDKEVMIGTVEAAQAVLDGSFAWHQQWFI
jgi:hypothetical protein